MSRTFNSPTTAALAARVLKRRNFLWITAPQYADRSTINSIGFWDDRATITAPVYDFDTGDEVTRTYVGAGGLLSLDDIPLTSDLTVQNFTAKLSNLQADVVNYFRAYDLHKAPVEIHRGMFNPGTYKLAEPAYPRWIGYIDKAEFDDPIRGGDGSIAVTLVSHTRGLTRINAEVRDGPSQKARNADDTFYDDTATCGSWTVFWGQTRATLATPVP